MNAATRAAVRYCIRQGHTLLTIQNGFRGLLNDNVMEPTWLSVDAWMSRGGSELGTNRALPSIDLGAVAAKFQQFRFDAFMMIGGFEAFNSLLILQEARKHYPAFHIPMAHLPATISNNVPMTEYSLGTDTSLNALVDACDAIKQSASASRNRVFVVETQGGKCGYIATLGALAVCIFVFLGSCVSLNFSRSVQVLYTHRKMVSAWMLLEGMSDTCGRDTALMWQGRVKDVLLSGMHSVVS